MSLKVIKIICGKSAGLVFKLTGFKFLKNIMERFSSNVNWSTEFGFGDSFDSAWGHNDPSRTNNTIFGKILLVLRICSLLGALIAFFLRNKLGSQQPPAQVEIIDMEATGQPTAFEQKELDFDDVKNLYDDIKLLEADEKDQLHKSLQAIKEEADQFTADLKELDNSIVNESSNSSCKSKEDGTEPVSPNSETASVLDMKLDKLLHESLSPLHRKNSKETSETIKTDEKNTVLIKSEDLNTEIKSGEEKANDTLIMTPPPAIIISAEELENTLKSQAIIIEQDPVLTKPLPQESTAKPVKEHLVSEDFWKNEGVYKKIEDIQMEEKKATEEKKVFELPSVLQTLRAKTPAANKPWLMKKKKTIETPVEPIQPVVVAEVNITQETPVETPAEIKNEVVEVPQTMEVPGKTEEITA